MSVNIAADVPKLGPVSNKIRISMSIRKIDNGFILTVDKNTQNGYEMTELAITSLPKLLRAVGTFFKEAENVD